VAEQERTGPTEDELLAALDKVGVADVLVQALAASVSIGYRRVSAEARDLPQARLAIESLRALEPVLRENGVDEALVRDLEQARANLQLAYAAAAVEDAKDEGGDRTAGAAHEEPVGEGETSTEGAAEPGAAATAPAEPEVADAVPAPGDEAREQEAPDEAS
jgi:hypothetical protein